MNEPVKNLIIYLDSEVEELRLEAKSLEVELSRLSDEKATLEKAIYEFDGICGLLFLTSSGS
jgi:predicted nuclease with TOPRIM domain